MSVVRGNFAKVAETVTEESREWFTAAELAELNLPGLPGDKRSLNRRAKDERWQQRRDANAQLLARPRAGRGGGVEFHVSLLPGLARLALAERGLIKLAAAPVEVEAPREGSWRWYDAQSAKVKAEAERRVRIIAEIDLMEAAGVTRTNAIAQARRSHGVSTSTLWNWLRLVDGVAAADRLPALAPRRQGGGREAEIDPDLWDLFKSDYLRDSAATLAICYAKVARVAAERGLSVPSEKKFRRKLEAEVPKDVLTLARKGSEALRRSLPAQRRSVAEFHALELVNIDGHTFDVFAHHEDGTRFRPVMIGIQDVYSRKLLAWRIGDAESAILTRLAFADLFRKFGIPREVFSDNGRAFASKWITGKMLNRYRFKVKEDEPSGLLTTLGVKVHWTLPYRGQSKPIERAWRDLCDSISRCAAFQGAYTGNNTLNKPESYGKRSIPIAEFIEVVEREIAFHNARTGRRTEMAKGRSFDAVFEESYVRSPITKATPEQLRLALLTGENRKINSETGELSLLGNRYWSPECKDLHGQLVTVRFDPDDLRRDVHLYGLDGQYLGDMQVIDDTGFASVGEAKGTAKLVADVRKAAKANLEAERRFTAAQVAAQQRGFQESPVPEPVVLRPARLGSQTALRKPMPEPIRDTAEDDIVAALGKVNLRIVD